MVRNTVSEVMMVRLNVSLIALLMMVPLSVFFHYPAVFTNTVKYNYRIVH